MPSKFAELALTVLLPTLQTIETTVFIDLLEKMHEHDASDHKATVQSIYPGLLRLKEFAKKTKTQFDNVGVDGLIAAVEASAEAHGINLSE